MRAWPVVAILAFAAGTATVALGKTGRGEQPPWLEPSEKAALATYFGGAHLTLLGVYPGARRIRVIFEFQDVVACRRCSHPAGTPAPHGRVVRVTFARGTHRLSGPMKLCDPHGNTEPFQACLGGAPGVGAARSAWVRSARRR